MNNRLTLNDTPVSNQAKVVVATTVLLSFISFWRAAAIVLNDLASSAYYVGGIAEQAIGKSAPWFILGVMLFSYAVRAVYVESCAMFTRGGVYRSVKEGMGGTLAKISVSALMFDYILTGPISGVSAGQYLAGLINDTMLHSHWGKLTYGEMNLIAVCLAIAVTVYFWWQNIKGIHESSERALRIMQITTVMVVLIIVWCIVTAIYRGAQLPPLPTRVNLVFHAEAFGWLKTSFLATLTPIIVLVGFGHSILAMSGEESLAQVNREIEHPKTKNLQRAGMVIFVYSLVFTSLISFFAVMLIPDDARKFYFENLISGLAMHVVGPLTVRLLLQAFVVVVGFLILAGAVNTAIVGSNGVLNRVSEDGVLSTWFRAPHKRFGTTYRLINLVVILQLVTILISRGDVFVLGEAYAFGVIWSFSFNALSVLVLRFKRPGQRAWRVPFNPKLFGREIPVGLGLVTFALFIIAVINIFTKPVATVSGLIFTAAFFTIFTISEIRMKRRQGDSHYLDQFQLVQQESIDEETFEARPGSMLVVVRDYNTMRHLDRALNEVDTRKQDVVVMTVRVMEGPSGTESFYQDEVFGSYEQQLFTNVVAIAERQGKKVNLLVVPSTEVFQGIAQTAFRIKATKIIAGRSSVMPAEEQSRLLGVAWEQISGSDRQQLSFEVVEPDGKTTTFLLGIHMPSLTDEDAAWIHKLWLNAVNTPAGDDIHHRDIVVAGLKLLEEKMKGSQSKEIAALIKNKKL